MRSPQNMSVGGMLAVAPASTARLKEASASVTYIHMLEWLALPPISGKTSFTKSIESPMRSAACQTFSPLGSFAWSTTSAPNAFL